MSRNSTALASVLVLLLAGGCGDYRHPLPNGYELVRVYGGALGVANARGQVIVGPTEYGIVVAVEGDLVVGNLNPEAVAYGAPKQPDAYFIINTRSGTASSGLSEPAYLSELAALGVRPPKLHRPSRFSL